MLHETKNRGGYASARSLRGTFTDIKQTGESWDVGDNKGYAALSAIQLSAIMGKKRIEILLQR